MSQAKLSSSSPDVGTNVGLIDQAFGIEVDAAAGAIGIKEGTVFLTGTAARAMTLVAPTPGLPSAGGDDGKVLRIVGVTAHAHTVTTPANKINGADDTVTFGTAGFSVELVAYNGVWYVNGTPTAALSEV